MRRQDWATTSRSFAPSVVTGETTGLGEPHEETHAGKKRIGSLGAGIRSRELEPLEVVYCALPAGGLSFYFSKRTREQRQQQARAGDNARSDEKSRQHLAWCRARLRAVEAKGDNAELRPNAENCQCDDADRDSLPA